MNKINLMIKMHELTTTCYSENLSPRFVFYVDPQTYINIKQLTTELETNFKCMTL